MRRQCRARRASRALPRVRGRSVAARAGRSAGRTARRLASRTDAGQVRARRRRGRAARAQACRAASRMRWRACRCRRRRGSSPRRVDPPLAPRNRSGWRDRRVVRENPDDSRGSPALACRRRSSHGTVSRGASPTSAGSSRRLVRRSAHRPADRADRRRADDRRDRPRGGSSPSGHGDGGDRRGGRRGDPAARSTVEPKNVGLTP